MAQVARHHGPDAHAIRARRDRDIAESDVSIAFGALFAGACALGWIVGASVHWELLAILGAIVAVALAVEATYSASE